MNIISNQQAFFSTVEKLLRRTHKEGSRNPRIREAADCANEDTWSIFRDIVFYDCRQFVDTHTDLKGLLLSKALVVLAFIQTMSPITERQGK